MISATALNILYLLIGAIRLLINIANAHAQLSYWIGTYCGKGDASEVGQVVIGCGFQSLTFHRITVKNDESHLRSE
ncbi:hypothetical protein IFO70_30815 [Phormidium tenue FACHB-886]|nr:hypothetical protein [Phormidium tenue FACHB-886]